MRRRYFKGEPLKREKMEMLLLSKEQEEEEEEEIESYS